MGKIPSRDDQGMVRTGAFLVERKKKASRQLGSRFVGEISGTAGEQEAPDGALIAWLPRIPTRLSVAWATILFWVPTSCSGKSADESSGHDWRRRRPGQMRPEGMFDAFSPIESLRRPLTKNRPLRALRTTDDVDMKMPSCHDRGKRGTGGTG